ncbi:uncharacterized protein METZ01_LOCUS59582 [marine metagenome]|uniref:Homoserine dehydrogenase n=1 Tax=marine metagenome TaxID=408172 RepID=A0A381STT2_9ZZZZ
MRLILVGFGTVGRGVAESLLASEPELLVAGAEPRVVAVVDPVVGSVRHEGGLDLETLLKLADAGESLASYPRAEPVADLKEVLDAAGGDVLVELTPTDLHTGEPGLGHVRAALKAGLHVVTTNKGPIALAYDDLRNRAHKAGVQLRFEGTVLSGTPVLNLCEAGLTGAGIREIRGVVNGTCNFILTEMEGGTGYAKALSKAQHLGYAEADPSGDVEGWDAAAKVLILANSVLNANLKLGDVKRTGISGLTVDDIQTACAAGKTWRLIARISQGENGWKAKVGPEKVNRADPEGSLTGPENLLIFDTEALGEVTITGPGAGRRATGHAVIADLLAVHRTCH